MKKREERPKPNRTEMLLLIAALQSDPCSNPAQVAARMKSLPDRDVKQAYEEVIQTLAE